MILVIAGPNGAGKSTLAPVLLRETLAVRDYVNADLIAQGLSAFNSEAQAFRAGRIMIRRLRDFAKENRSFSFESTLATRSYAPWLRELCAERYLLRIVFLALPSADMAVERVRARVRSGGHSVPEDIIRRRFARGITNFLSLYSPIAAQWSVLDNSATDVPLSVATGSRLSVLEVPDSERWTAFKEGRMANPESNVSAEALEFASVALASLTEAVRRALVEHKRRGERVPAWDGSRVVWVDPGEHLHKFPVCQSTFSVANGAEQVVAADVPTASRSPRG